MTKLNYKPNALNSSILICLIVLIFFGLKDTIFNDPCYSATYSIATDYSNEDLPFILKKKLSKVAKQNKKIYKIVQSSTHSFEQVDSIAHTCGGESIMVKPEVVIREIGQESVDYFYNTETVQKCYSVQEPEFLDGWIIRGPIPYKNSDDRYFRASKENSDDFVIFDSKTPISFNLKMICELPGLVVEASIGMQHILLLESGSLSSSKLDGRIKQLQEINRVKVKRVEHIDFNELIGSYAELISSNDFECVESLW